MEDEKKELSFKQKLAVFSLAIFAIIVFLVLVINMRNGIYKPFKYVMNTDTENCPSGNCPSKEDEHLLDKDTDNDGLSDWDELNIYKTSPYLEDSDSDGSSDKEEIEQGFNPNCPKGEICNTGNSLLGNGANKENIDISSKDIELINLLSDLDSLVETQEQGELKIKKDETGYSDDELKSILEGEGGATELRTLLLNAGMSKEILDKIDDETLLQNYKEILQNS